MLKQLSIRDFTLIAESNISFGFGTAIKGKKCCQIRITKSIVSFGEKINRIEGRRQRR
jgi:hypothetical protein